MVVRTKEQKRIIDHVANNFGILLIEAGPGTGKTSTSIEIIKTIKPEMCLYTAFNKAIVEDSKTKMEQYGVQCKTFHALAYQYVKPLKPISELTYLCITEDLTYPDKNKVITAINAFFVSASSDMYEFMDTAFKDDEHALKELSVRYINEMINGNLAPSFGFLLKFFHLMLLNKGTNISFDMVILDEINDVTGVALEIFKLLKAPRKIGLGETNQAIYGFMNLVNGFEILSDAPRLPLTKSFRCSTKIASQIQNFMRAYLNEEYVFTGTDETVGNGKTLYCTRTNSQAIVHIAEQQSYGKGFTLLRKPSEIFACPLAIITAGAGKEVYDRKYKFLENEYRNFKKTGTKYKNYMSYIKESVEDKEIESAINLLHYLRTKNINIFDVYKRAKEQKPDPKTTIATVFTAKGLEFEHVHISDDLNSAVVAVTTADGVPEHEYLTEIRCYFVAVSRAQKTLKNASMLLAE